MQSWLLFKFLSYSAFSRRGHQNIEDEDFIEIGVDEDLALADESKNEVNFAIRKVII